MRLFQGHRVRQKACLLFCSRINKTQKIDYNFPIVSFCLSSDTKMSTKLSAENKVIYEIRGGKKERKMLDRTIFGVYSA